MEQPVKRQYRSPAREAAAEETRARIREAARELFIAKGYTATTLKDVAERAGVGERTLYDSFGSKFGLMRHTVAMLTMGDESRVPAADRPAAVAARAMVDPREALAAHLRLGTDLMNRAGDLLLVSGANPDPELERSIERGTAAAYDINLQMAQRLHARGELRPGMSAATAADIMFTLTSPGVFHVLRRTRRWGQQRYQDWVIESATQQLLVDG